MRAKIELQIAKERGAAQEAAKKLEGVVCRISAKVSNEGRLYGSVTVGDIVEALSFYFETRNAPAALRVLVYGMMAVWQMTALLVACLGFVDTWADFRRLRRAGESDPDDDEPVG